jgi:hypothetical protein
MVHFLRSASTDCGTAPTPGEAPARADVLTAELRSPAAIRLEWPQSTGARLHVLEGRYGANEFFIVAELPAGCISFTDFSVPGSNEIDGRLSTRTGEEQRGGPVSISVWLPGLAPDPLEIESQAAFAPGVDNLP